MDAAPGVGNMAALAAGAISFLSPCVLPLVPAYLSYIAGDAVGGAQDQPRHSRLFTLALSASFVLGFSLVFVGLGASATAVGRVLLQYKEQANIVERAVILSPGHSLQVPIADLQTITPARAPAAPSIAASVTLADAEREYIITILRNTNWMVGGPKGAAARLGMKRSTLQSRMKKLGIENPE